MSDIINNSNTKTYDDYQYVDNYQRSINITINLSELDNPKNLEYKSFFFLNLSAKEQERLLGMSFTSFMKELDRQYKIHQKSKNSKHKNSKSFLSKFIRLFK